MLDGISTGDAWQDIEKEPRLKGGANTVGEAHHGDTFDCERGSGPTGTPLSVICKLHIASGNPMRHVSALSAIHVSTAIQTHLIDISPKHGSYFANCFQAREI